MRGTHLSQMIKSQNKIIYTFWTSIFTEKNQHIQN